MYVAPLADKDDAHTRNYYWTFPLIVAGTIIALAAFDMIDWTPALWAGGVMALSSVGAYLISRKTFRNEYR